MGCDCGANAAPGLFSVQTEGLEALGPSFGVARSGKTEGDCRFARALKYGPIASSKCLSHLISGSLKEKRGGGEIQTERFRQDEQD